MIYMEFLLCFRESFENFKCIKFNFYLCLYDKCYYLFFIKRRICMLGELVYLFEVMLLIISNVCFEFLFFE